jgi:hypothetical protein
MAGSINGRENEMADMQTDKSGGILKKVERRDWRVSRPSLVCLRRKMGKSYLSY